MKLTRKEKACQSREQLCLAAAEIIALHGFKDASIVRITTQANMALGTFYNYFDTREALFSELIDNCGRNLRREAVASIPEGASFFEREEATFRSYFRFVKQNPFFIRVLNESEIFVPAAYERYFDSILQGYIKVLTIANRTKEIRPLKGVEIEGVALILMSARHYYGQRFLDRVSKKGDLPKRIVETYMDFVGGALRP